MLATLLRGRASQDLLGRVGLVVAANSLLLQWLGYEQDRTEYARPEPLPIVTVVVEQPDAADIERIVDERLREREQQHQADQPGSTAGPKAERDAGR